MATTFGTSQPPLPQVCLNGNNGHLPPGLDGSCRLVAAGEFWHRSAPRKLVSAQNLNHGENAWNAWRRHLEARNLPSASEYFQHRTPALLWGISPALGRNEFAAWYTCFRQVIQNAVNSPFGAGQLLDDWLMSVRESRPDSLHALQCLTIAFEIPQLARFLSDSQWWAVADYLYSTADDAQHWSADGQDTPDDVILQQWLAGELPLVMSLQFPEIEPLRNLRKSAYNILSKVILELTDGEGLLHCESLPTMRALLACWTRVALFARNWKKICWTDDARTQYEWLVRQAIRLSRNDGSQMLSDESQSEWSPMMFAAALELAGDASDCAAAHAHLPGKIVPADADFDDDDLPEPSVHSEWSGLAVLATSWSKGAPRLAIAYGQQPMQLELICGREILLSGDWSFELYGNGERYSVAGDWEEQCWLSDEDCDFLELAVELEHGLRLERQILLARDDEVLFVADYVHGADVMSYDFQYRSQLRLGNDVRYMPEPESRDGLLMTGKPRAAVIPIGLPEWRSDPRIGELSVEDSKLTITHRAVSPRFCCPLFVDFKPRRIKKERTWRQLTVAESLANVPADVAVGFRIQSGKDQWLVYRSLAPAGNRTVLGQNLSSEFLAGRFLSTGEIDEFIELEIEED